MPRTDSERMLIQSLITEWEMRKSEVGEIDTVYIGGGTPSILSVASMQQLVESIPAKSASEVTIEANPEDVDTERVRLWRHRHQPREHGHPIIQ